jgi:hypothetical protein
MRSLRPVVNHREARAWLARRSRVDTRALAALRVLLGGLLLADLVLRARDLTAHYTDSGAVPRAALFDWAPILRYLSVHALSGDAWWQLLLFGLAGVAAIALVLGYRTRLATACSLVLLVSLHARTPVVLNGGDILLRRLLFWGLFLPLGAQWSIDGRRTEGPPGDVATLASAALLVQVVLVYAVNAVLKHRSALWRDGDAVRYALSLEAFTTPLGDLLAQSPTLLTVVDWLWLTLLSGAVLLFLTTGWRRALLVGTLATMHLGMALTMHLGLFPLISLTALVPFVPSVVWDRVSVPAAVRTAGRALDDRLPTRSRTLPTSVTRLAGDVAPVVVAVLLTLVLAYNAATLTSEPVVSGVDALGHLGDAEQRWKMFAPAPPGTDVWYVVPGRLANGTRVAAFRGGPVSGDRPPDVSKTYPNQRWRKLLLRLRTPSDARFRESFATSLCRRWQRTHDSMLEHLTVYVVEQETRLAAPEPISRRPLVHHVCAA